VGKEGESAKKLRMFSRSEWSSVRNTKGSSCPGVLVLFALPEFGPKEGCVGSSFGFFATSSGESRLMLDGCEINLPYSFFISDREINFLCTESCLFLKDCYEESTGVL
jgi:hypothetical protein